MIRTLRDRLPYAVLVLVTLVAAVVVGIASAANPGVDPQTVAQTVNPGDSFIVPKVVHTPVIPPRPDVMFLADTTFSMVGAIANVQANATTISAMGKCTSTGCNRPISAIRRYRPAAGAIYSGE